VTVQPEVLLIAAAAIVPPALVAVLVARLLPTTGRSGLAALVAFCWGAAVASAVAAAVNDAAGALGTATFGAARARALLPTLVGPAVEELAKATGFAVVFAAARGALAGTRSPIVIGALLGLGFAAAENVGYYTLAAVQGGQEGLGRAVYLRGLVQSGNHAVFTATAGAGLAWAHAHAASGWRRLETIALGLAVAIGLHAIWNGFVSIEITSRLCNAPASATTCAPVPDPLDLLVVVPALEAAFIIPILAGLALVVRRGAPRDA
jgi:RsiW-degrading membrane proteinase PrsW (M82 family)